MASQAESTAFSACMCEATCALTAENRGSSRIRPKAADAGASPTEPIHGARPIDSLIDMYRLPIVLGDRGRLQRDLRPFGEP